MTRSPGVPRAAVIIPAHNEEAVIGRCLATLLGTAEPGEFEVVVACNGCRDATADIARQWGPDVQVLEISEASKTAAMQAADDFAQTFPRVYLDADIKLDGQSARRLADALSGPASALAAAPRMTVQLADRPWRIRAFYQMWQFVPWFNEAPLGDGCIGLSAEGRARFDQWPAIVADDLFANRLFSAAERRVVPDATFVVGPPRTLRSLVNVRTRIYIGNLQYEEALRAGKLPGTTVEPAVATSYLPALHSPRLWPALGLYVAITAIARLRARVRLSLPHRFYWDRDETARTG